MQRLMLRRYRLKTLLQSLQHPRTCKIDIGNEVVQLPYKLPFRLPSYFPESSVDQADMEKLAYGFSVFGWVTPLTCGSGICVNVRTRHSRTFLPVMFCRTFGGGVYLDRTAKGVALPGVIWKITGCNAIKICKFLSQLQFQSRKKEILKIGAGWPSKRNESIETAKQIRSVRKHIRRNFFQEAKIDNWRDFAELFDSRGHVSVFRRSNIRITVSHPYSDVLISICDFLESTDITASNFSKKIYQNTNTNNWSCDKISDIKAILSKLLQHGLTFQRLRAEVALNFLLRKGKRRVFLEHIPNSTNSMKYRRASKEECRIKEFLLSLTAQLERERNLPLRSRKEKDKLLQGLKQHHQRKKIEAVKNEMRSDIRLLLRQHQ